MKLVVDTNKIVACLLKDGKVRKLFFSPFLELYTHQYAVEEIRNHENELLKKVSKQAYGFILNKAVSKLILIKFSPKDEENLRIAKCIAENFDVDDYPFIALALKLGIPIWTNDKEMIAYSLKSKRYLALDTKAVEELIRGKSLDEIKGDLKKRYLTFE